MIVRVALVAVALAAAATANAGTVLPKVPRFDHVIVVVFENKERGDVVGSTAAPTFNSLARRYSQLVGYHGVAHPSLPNYLALVSGSTQGIHDDCTDCVVTAVSLADTLGEAHRTWKTYAEGLPSPGFTGAGSGAYAKKHDPFLYFANVLRRPAWLRRVVRFSSFDTDLRAGRLPSFSLVVPNLCNDMHDCDVPTGDLWLARHIVPILGSPHLARSVVFVIFDEGTTDIGGGGSVAALALGPVVRPGSTYAQLTNHYGLLRTIEDAWGLPRLGASKDTSPITGIWR
jgi:phosphatidylinositol-3-phosphatase